MQSDTLQQPYTILRIKRKRNEEPLDALVVESVRRKKSRPGLDVFRFAETVAEGEWDERRAKEVQDRISALARERMNNPAAIASEARPRPDSTRQYTVITQEDPQVLPRLPVAPPQVMSTKELERQKQQKINDDFKLYDAILASDAPPVPSAPEVDEEMEKFQSLLQDYLQVHDITPFSPPLSALASSRALPVQMPPPSAPSDDPDYVYDVFYHRAGALLENENVTNIGTLIGLPASFADPNSSDSESEEEDEADEDSNAEEYYKNDYPEEDSYEGSSDEFHEHSEDDDFARDDDHDDHEWR
ncbi:hypothetical protein HETIRDRAFT_451648 [Heterobasidion irregulare TC 32-1]|uniref:Probable RNA polymerase II nuclear localization protein SLC7A6OS n=1 Tax=Heterobasidion irregulare (strain TC 32-1) TaxID=747525 RepID=W4K8B0_HETIT|nr:uncharacterized protein HETIRDRAFT_451648 [Heterobasidion irregulare TC 32-1]ETW81994.1 hypothetical protein HETIRDRAFT_451648 [Heterobasidion irregulare TC 32-1]